MARMQPMETAPRDRRILLKANVYHLIRNEWRIVGTRWIEGLWRDGTPFGDKPKWHDWCGTPTAISTAHIDPIGWAELPEE